MPLWPPLCFLCILRRLCHAKKPDGLCRVDIMKAVIVREKKQPAAIEELDDTPLGEGELEILVEWSSLNYKDAMALAGNPGVVRTVPLVPGIDVVGTTGTRRVLLNGAGLGERRHGGYADRVRIPARDVIDVPEAFSPRQAAALGTAGFTAGMCVDAVKSKGNPASAGPVLVTGATGGVGSIAVHLLHTLGYEVTAATGRADRYADYLSHLGADHIIDREEIPTERALASGRWANVVDTIGSRVLAGAIAQTTWGGVVAACGMAGGTDLHTTVMPFILRGVQLIGCNSVDAPRDIRERIWRLLADTVDTTVLDELTEEVTLDGVLEAGKDLLDGARHGRTVVAVSKQ